MFAVETLSAMLHPMSKQSEKAHTIGELIVTVNHSRTDAREQHPVRFVLRTELGDNDVEGGLEG
jgi:hypothetical protein